MRRDLTSRNRQGRRRRGISGVGSMSTRPRNRSDKETAPQGLMFTDALYYPFIEIPDEGWLKTAVLYWNSISTIVPESVNPFRSETAKALHDAGILQSLVVYPTMRELADVADEVMNYVTTEEGMRVLLPSDNERWAYIHSDKFSRIFREEMHQAKIHFDKLAPELWHCLHHLGKRAKRDNPWVEVPARFAGYYMTLLATYLATSKGRALLTDDIAREALAARARLGSVQLSQPPRSVARSVAEGLLATTTLNAINIGPDTPVRRILSFREKHEVALAEFRSSLRDLLTTFSVPGTPEALSSAIQSVYRDKVIPAVEKLRGRLRDHRLTLGFNNLKATTLLSAAPTALGTLLSTVGLGPYALFAGAGLSVVLQTVNYRTERREILRASPFSYLLAAEKKFGRKSPRS
jgi:hypothetical protein